MIYTFQFNLNNDIYAATVVHGRFTASTEKMSLDSALQIGEVLRQALKIFVRQDLPIKQAPFCGQVPRFQ